MHALYAAVGGLPYGAFLRDDMVMTHAGLGVAFC